MQFVTEYVFHCAVFSYANGNWIKKKRKKRTNEIFVANLPLNVLSNSTHTINSFPNAQKLFVDDMYYFVGKREREKEREEWKKRHTKSEIYFCFVDNLLHVLSLLHWLCASKIFNIRKELFAEKYRNEKKMKIIFQIIENHGKNNKLQVNSACIHVFIWLLAATLSPKKL